MNPIRANDLGRVLNIVSYLFYLFREIPTPRCLVFAE